MRAAGAAGAAGCRPGRDAAVVERGRGEEGHHAFVTRVTTEGGPDFVAASERIAVFDNDGTLWAEQPIYVQLVFALDRVKALAPQHPEWQYA